MTQVFSKMLEYIYTDTLIYIPIIEGINITSKNVVKYEDPNYEFPEKDMIKPIIKKALKKQSLKFFTDFRSHNEKNDIQVRVLYGKDFLNFNEKWVTQIKKKCCYCKQKGEEPVYVYKSVSAAEQNLKFEIEKIIIHFHGGAFVAHNSF